jgi:uncharacterized membrane protein (DUF485 family)
MEVIMKKLYFIFISFLTLPLPIFINSRSTKVLKNEKVCRHQCKKAQKCLDTTETLIQQTEHHLRLIKTMEDFPSLKAKQFILKEFISHFDKSRPYTTYRDALQAQIRLFQNKIISLNKFLITLANQGSVCTEINSTIAKAEEIIHILSTLKVFIESNCQEQLKKESPRLNVPKFIAALIICAIIAVIVIVAYETFFVATGLGAGLCMLFLLGITACSIPIIIACLYVLVSDKFNNSRIKEIFNSADWPPIKTPEVIEA